jgi:crotonobetainyl-CoA:carnitine CoA-transferase CaiB-like acyl-CoA transferase
MDHTGAMMMAIAILLALVHRQRTGEGQWVDMSCTDAGLGLTGPDLLDYTVNDRPLRRPGMPDSNKSDSPPMAPHGIYPTDEVDCWVAIACRDDDDWNALGTVCTEEWVADARFEGIAGRLAAQAELDERVASWTSTCNRYDVAARLRAVGVPAGAVAMSEDRIDHDPDTAAWGLFPVAHHPEIGDVRVDGLPVHLSVTDWRVERGAPMLGEHNRAVLCGLLGVTDDEFVELEESGVL